MHCPETVVYKSVFRFDNDIIDIQDPVRKGGTVLGKVA